MVLIEGVLSIFKLVLLINGDSRKEKWYGLLRRESGENVLDARRHVAPLSIPGLALQSSNRRAHQGQTWVDKGHDLETYLGSACMMRFWPKQSPTSFLVAIRQQQRSASQLPGPCLCYKEISVLT
jgi:hypothetical protein